MNDEFEKALQRALRPQSARGDLSERVAARLDSRGVMPLGAAALAFVRGPAFRSRWLPAALAACLIAVIGLIQVRQHALDTARAHEARAQLLEALSIASDNVNIVRAVVAREENPDS